MSKLIFAFWYIVAAALTIDAAVTEEERAAFRRAIVPIVTECSTEHDVKLSDIEAARKAKDPKAIKPCYIGCILRRIGVLDSNGFYDGDAGLKNLRQFVKNDEDFAKFEKVAKKCYKVNDEPVSDGVFGCDRASMILACALEFKNEMPIHV